MINFTRTYTKLQNCSTITQNTNGNILNINMLIQDSLGGGNIIIMNLKNMFIT